MDTSHTQDGADAVTGGVASDGAPDEETIRAALDRVTASDGFARSGRARELLTYVADEALAGRGDRINSKTIAQDVFGRDEAFDASADPLVRVQMGRTRNLLEAYYEGEGRDDPVLIEIPRGTYRPDFRPREVEAVPAPAAPTGDRPSDGSLTVAEAEARPRRRAGALAMGGLAATLVLLGLGALFLPEPPPTDADYPVVAVLPFEDLTGSEGGEADLGAGFQRQIASDLQRFRTVRVAVAEGEERPDAQYEVTGSVLSVDQNVDFVLRLRRPGGDRPLLSERLRSGEDADYFEALSDLSARATGHLAGPAGALEARVREVLHLPGAEGGEAFRCYVTFERFVTAKTPEGLAESYACLSEATRRRPGDGTMLAALAWTIALGAPEADQLDAGPLAREMSLPRALSVAEQAVEVDPGNDDAHAHLGTIQWRVGLEREALASLRRAVALNPGNPQHAASLAHLLAFSGDWDEAERMVRRAINRSGDPPGWYEMPLYYRALMRGRGERALEHLARNEAGGDPYLPIYALAAAVEANDTARILALRPIVEALATARGGDPLRGAREWIRSDEILTEIEARLEEAGVSVLRS